MAKCISDVFELEIFFSQISAFYIFVTIYKQLLQYWNNISYLTLSGRGPLSNRNQSIDLHWKLKDWFLNDNGPRHERFNEKMPIFVNQYFRMLFRNIFYHHYYYLLFVPQCSTPEVYLEPSWTSTMEFFAKTFNG